MNKYPLSCLVAVWLALVVPCALAEKADRDKPMNVEADALRYDDARQISVFTGRVVLTKGTILIRGGRLEVRQDPQGYQYGVVTAEPGKLAYFRQKREGVDEFIEGEGETIDYDGRADTVKFITRAQLRRYQGVTLNDEFNAGVIVYNNTTDVFTLDGAPGAGKSSSTGQPGAPAGRVRAMLTPKPEAASASAAKPATPLRETPTLGGAKP
ncbi:lipopolysaccharide transport periplasmic protein LptA [Rhodoferax sp.]|uniref:lipopolysaccharide transport periplasmic protein LptA n=1 Tax=Rhodoferax sp. TaxID=50421 RepID=UPI002608F5BD|nr:lipopolysaccharide transport periplasmic protein LptA [Rhodoferax sp.]MDD2925775.1 lipopolysaccharide transport periplasmic protein LptA [Rhodoferax sp.]